MAPFYKIAIIQLQPKVSSNDVIHVLIHGSSQLP